MRYALALLGAAAVFIAVSHPGGRAISARVGDYLKPGDATQDRGRAETVMDWAVGAGMSGRVVAAGAGALAGVLLAQGDLFLTGPGRSVLPLAVLGAVAGWLLVGMHRSTARQRRSRRLRFELPVVADSLALHIIAGESVGTAIAHFVDSSEGVAADEFDAVLAAHQDGLSLSEALQRAGHRTADDEAQRLYTLLAHAHDTGGRLAESLIDLSSDYRAGLTRDLSAEGGRRALAIYGPVLAFMVPVTLLFLLYPTLAGLRSLAGSP